MDHINPVLDVFNPDTGKYHKLWRFHNEYGVSAVKQPPSAQTRGTDGTDWCLAIIRFTDPHSWDFEICYDHPLCEEQGDLFLHVPDDQVDAIVLLAARSGGGKCLPPS